MHVAAGGIAAFARALDRRVAIPAIDAELTRVQRVAVRHRLIRLVADPDRLRRHAVREKRDEVDGRAEDQQVDPLLEGLGPFRE